MRDERSPREARGRAVTEGRGARDQRRPRPARKHEGNESSGAKPVDRKIAAVADRQRGLITQAQLLRLGVSKGATHRRAARGLLHRVHRGVYLVGHTLWLPGARELAAVLACGPADALVSHASVLALTGTLGDAPDEVHVTVPGRRVRSQPGIVVHRAPALHRSERMRVGGIPATSLTRALLDIAAEDHPQLETAVSEAQARRLVTQAQLRRYVTAATGRRGVDRLRTVVLGNETGFTRSEAERVMRRLCRQARLPQPRTNVPFEGYEIDFLWPGQRLVVEVDGYGAHSSRSAFERDRRKQMALVAAGYRVIRVTWRQLQEEPVAVAVAIARALGPDQPRH